MKEADDNSLHTLHKCQAAGGACSTTSNPTPHSPHLLPNTGVVKLLEIASEVEELRDECSINVTANTRLTAAILMGKIYEDMGEEKERSRLTEHIEEFMKCVVGEGGGGVP